MFYFTSAIVLILLTISSPKASQGTVQMLRGTSTALFPHQLEAVVLKKGDVVVEDSSIVTHKKSFVKILMDDGSNIIVGPSSKVIVSIKSSKSTLINLLKGKLRVQANTKKKKHIFIKTKSASIGVRGTDFVTSYTPRSDRTSVLTFEGNVAVAKDRTPINNTNNKELKNKIIEEIDKLLDHNVIHVKTSDFTAIAFNDEKVIEPVKINPTQFLLLKKDLSMGTVKQNIKLDTLSSEVAALSGDITKNNQANKTGFKHGGFISQEEGIYIPPKDNLAKEKIGKITRNGKFVPPKGLKLDAGLGFIAKDKSDKLSVLKANTINETLGKQVKTLQEALMYDRYFKVE